MLKYTMFGTGKPLVFLHGALVDENMWFPQVTFFEQYYKVILISLPEHGASADIGLENYNLENMKDSVVEVLEYLGLQKCHICGHDLGGTVALKIALSKPELVDKLIIFESACGVKKTNIEKITSLLEIYFLKVLPRDALYRIYAKKYGQYSERANLYVLSAIPRHDKKHVIRVLNAELSNPSEEKLRGLKKETLIIVGQNGSILGEKARAMNKHIRNSRLKRMKDAGYFANLDKKKIFNNILLEFLGTTT